MAPLDSTSGYARRDPAGRSPIGCRFLQFRMTLATSLAHCRLLGL